MIQSFNGLTVILDGKFSFYSYIIIKKWKMRVFDILPVAKLYKNVMYIENTCTFAILQISNGYRKIFQGSESADLLEIWHASKGIIFET